MGILPNIQEERRNEQNFITGLEISATATAYL